MPRKYYTRFFIRDNLFFPYIIETRIIDQNVSCIFGQKNVCSKKRDVALGGLEWGVKIVFFKILNPGFL